MKFPSSLAIAYNAKLQRVLRAIKRDIDEQVIPAIKSARGDYVADSWTDSLASILERIIAKWTGPQFSLFASVTAREFVRIGNARSERDFAKMAGRNAIGIRSFGNVPGLDDALAAATYQNAQLIKSIPAQYLTQVSSIVMGNMRAGMRPSAIVSELVNQFGVTSRRAAMIARDQTSKVNGEVSRKRQQGAGFEYFRWVDSDDERVRTRHHEIATRKTEYGIGVYRWDDLPLSDDGKRIAPGDDYNCRCIAVPVSDDAVKAWRAKNGL